MSEEFKLPASSYEEIVKIIKAYGNAKKETTLEELSKLCGVPTTTISRNSAFLVGIDVVENSKPKVVTDRGKELSRALEYNNIEVVSKIWRDIIIENEFLSKMITAIKIRNGMDHQSFVSHIAYSSGQANNNYVKAGANTIIELFRLSNLINDVDGKLLVSNNHDDRVETFEKSLSVKKENVIEQIEEINQAKRSAIYNSNFKKESGININIEIKVEVKIDELELLGEKLKKMLSEIQEE